MKSLLAVNDEGDDDTKAKSRSISLLPEMWADVRTIAAKHFGKKKSAYIQALLAADLFRVNGQVRSRLKDAGFAQDDEAFAAQLIRVLSRPDVREKLRDSVEARIPQELHMVAQAINPHR